MHSIKDRLRESLPTTHLNRLTHFWIKAVSLNLLLFIIGTLISRSLVNFSKYFSIIISIKFFLIILLQSRESTPLSHSKKYSPYLICGMFVISVGTTLTLLGWAFRYLQGELLLSILSGMAWPLLIWFTGWRKGIFSDSETLHWWWFNGLLWWFIITFIFRDIGIIEDLSDTGNLALAQRQLRGVLTFAFSFTLPLTLFYLFLKMIVRVNAHPHQKRYEEFHQIIKTLGIAGIISLTTLAIMGLPSLFSLSTYWPTWETISQSLAISTNNGRLSSFHFVLDLGNLLIQGVFIILAWTLGHYFLSSPKPTILSTLHRVSPKGVLSLGLGTFLLVMFILTWTKLLIPFAFILLTLFFIIVFRNYLLHIAGASIVSLGLLLGIIFSTDNQLNQFGQDISKVVKVIENHFFSNHRSLNQSLVDDLIEADLINAPSFIYRLQHHIWGWDILTSHPLTGIGPYGYTDYVIDHYSEDLPHLPHISLSQPNTDADWETKKKLLTDEKNINRSLLSPHSDWVMVVSSGGIPGMFFYYGLFILLISYFISVYGRSGHILYLGAAFALLAMLASGITEPNFKEVHFHLLSVYALVFMGSKFITVKNEII